MAISTIYKASIKESKKLPLYISEVYAGFPSPAEDHIDLNLDLNEHLIKHPAATFYIYAKGDSMINAGIYNGDLMIVDRALEPGTNSIIIAIINGEFTVKKVKKVNRKLYLIPDNKKYSMIEITEDMDFEIWGVVTYTIHRPT